MLQKIKEPTLPPPPTPKREKIKPEAKRIKTSNKLDILDLKYEDNLNLDDNGAVIQVKIVYNPSESIACTPISSCKTELNLTNPNGRTCDINSSGANESLLKGQTLLTSFFQPIRNKIATNTTDTFDDSIELTINIDENIAINDEEHQPEQKHLLWHRKQILRKYNRLKAGKYLIRKRHHHLLIRLASKARRHFSKHWHRFQRNKNVQFVYRYLISYHVFARTFLRQSKGKVEPNSTETTIESLAIVRRVQNILNDNNAAMRDASEENPQPTHNLNDVGAKRPKNDRSQRSTDNARQLLLMENVQESSEKDLSKYTWAVDTLNTCVTQLIRMFIVFAQRYIDRVEETFINENKHYKFIEFLGIILDFNENENQKTGADLYLVRIFRFFVNIR